MMLHSSFPNSQENFTQPVPYFVVFQVFYRSVLDGVGLIRSENIQSVCLYDQLLRLRLTTLFK